MVTMKDGMPKRLDRLAKGDIVVAAAADGSATLDAISLLSLSRTEAVAPFVGIQTAEGRTLNVTAGHHLCVAACDRMPPTWVAT